MAQICLILGIYDDFVPILNFKLMILYQSCIYIISSLKRGLKDMEGRLKERVVIISI